LFCLVTKSIATQQLFVDVDGRLRPFRDPYGYEQDVARHVAREIYAGDARILSIWIGKNTAIHIPLAAVTLGKIGRLMSTGRKEQANPA
jgi:hypothetical protein